MFYNEAIFLRGGINLHFVNREALFILCVDYALFSVVVIFFVLMLMLMTNAYQTQQDFMTSLSMMALSFIFVDLVIANFLVESIRLQTEMKSITYR